MCPALCSAASTTITRHDVANIVSNSLVYVSKTIVSNIAESDMYSLNIDFAEVPQDPERRSTLIPCYQASLNFVNLIP